MVTKERVAAQFGKQAEQYVQSTGHAKGNDLQIVVAATKANIDMFALDVATGAGHTACALAPLVKNVQAIDISRGMLDKARGVASDKEIANINFRTMDVENMQFANARFDLVTCRIAPHHFMDIQQAVCEIARVLKVEGCFVLEDNISPANARLDAFINLVETLRDPTHVRSYTKREWSQFLQNAGLKVTFTRNYRKVQNIAEWIEISGIDAEQANLVYLAFASASDEARRHFCIEYDANNKAVSFTDNKVILRAVKKK
jgi:ubiquinone/menaquinone biosynthesis C-methylase UbiE